MQYKLIIQGRFDALNDYTSTNRYSPYAGAKMKRSNEDLVIWSIRQQMRGVKITAPILIYYQFYEKADKRDNDNILSCGSKFTQDALVKTGVVKDDKRKYISNFYFDTFIDRKNPRVEIFITELTEEEAQMTLVNVIDSIRRRGCYSGG